MTVCVCLIGMMVACQTRSILDTEQADVDDKRLAAESDKLLSESTEVVAGDQTQLTDKAGTLANELAAKKDKQLGAKQESGAEAELEIVQSQPIVENGEVELFPSPIVAAPEIQPIPLPPEQQVPPAVGADQKNQVSAPEAQDLMDSSPPVKQDSVTDEPEVGESTEISGYKSENIFQITSSEKDYTHPFYGKGKKFGFSADGAQGATIVVQRGQKYVFNVQTHVQHDFYLSKNEVGWGAAAFTHGVEGHYTYRGHVTFSPDDATPDVLYYQCRNHKLMGGKIMVVAADADIASLRAKIAKEREQRLSQSQTQQVKTDIDPNKVKQKITYAEMLVKFKTKGLPESRIKLIQEKLDNAKQAFDAGANAQAMDLASETVLLIKDTSGQSVSSEALAEKRKVYEEALASLDSFKKSHIDAVKRAKKNADAKVVDYDHAEVERLANQSATEAQSENYDAATKNTKKAERIVTFALKEMLGSQTIVYEVVFDSPEEEYQYEVNRFNSYEELVPVAIEVKKPRPSAIKLMETYVKKGHFFKEKAEEAAKLGDYKKGIVIILDATKEVRRGLMLLGVTM